MNQNTPQPPNLGTAPMSREEILELLGRMQAATASEKRFTVVSYPAADSQAISDRP